MRRWLYAVLLAGAQPLRRVDDCSAPAALYPLPLILVPDEVKLNGRRRVNFYNAWYSREQNTSDPCPFRDGIRHRRFLQPAQVDLLRERGKGRNVAMELAWQMDRKTTVLSETREMRVVSLSGGEYLLDIVTRTRAA